MSKPRPDPAPADPPVSTRARGVMHTGATGVFRRKPIPLHEPAQEQKLKRSLCSLLQMAFLATAFVQSIPNSGLYSSLTLAAIAWRHDTPRSLFSGARPRLDERCIRTFADRLFGAAAHRSLRSVLV